MSEDPVLLDPETVSAYRRLQRLLDLPSSMSDPSHDPIAPSASAVVGRWAICGNGRLGRITGRVFTSFGLWAWDGVGLDGSPWCSTRPRLITLADATLLAACAVDRAGPDAPELAATPPILLVPARAPSAR